MDRVARIEGGIVAAIIEGDKALYPMPEYVAITGGVAVGLGDRYDAETGEFTPAYRPIEAAPDPAPDPAPRVSPVEFKLLFTPAERLAIKAARAYAGEEPALIGLKLSLDDFFEILDDPRLTYVDMGLQSTIDAVTGLATAGLIEAPRVAEILSGKLQ